MFKQHCPCNSTSNSLTIQNEGKKTRASSQTYKNLRELDIFVWKWAKTLTIEKQSSQF